MMFVVTAVETVGDISGVTHGRHGPRQADAITPLPAASSATAWDLPAAALFGVLPNTSFSQNVGLVTMTKMVNRKALACGAVFSILVRFVPEAGRSGLHHAAVRSRAARPS